MVDVLEWERGWTPGRLRRLLHRLALYHPWFMLAKMVSQA